MKRIFFVLQIILLTIVQAAGPDSLNSMELQRGLCLDLGHNSNSERTSSPQSQIAALEESNSSEIIGLVGGSQKGFHSDFSQVKPHCGGGAAQEVADDLQARNAALKKWNKQKKQKEKQQEEDRKKNQVLKDEIASLRQQNEELKRAAFSKKEPRRTASLG